MNFPYMLRSIIKVNLLLLLLCLTGCWHTYHIQQFQALPASEGFYGGSFLWETWEYYGTDANFHYVQYTYHKDNWVHSVNIRVPTNEVSMRLMRMTPWQRDPVCALEPIYVERNLMGFEWKPWNWKDPAFQPVIPDSSLSNVHRYLMPMELKLAPPPRIEDIRPHP